MSKDKNSVLRNIEMTIDKLRNNDFTLFFFVVDCNNVPNGSMQYIYQIAKTLYDKNYKVKMLYQLETEYSEEELKELKRKEMPIDENRVFTGVGEWLGEEYMEIPHINISKDEWTVGPADFLFIPEALSSLMKQTYQHMAPCKRIVIMHNFDYITDFIPFNDQWGTYGIHDVITNTEAQGKLITDVFPYVKTKVLSPYIAPCFRKPTQPKKLVVNIISKHTQDVNKVIKQFYWKYPMFKFITFRDLRGYPKEKYAEFLRESPITVWIDSETPFGYSALEAIKTGNIVIGKVPEHVPEWATDEEGMLVDNMVWAYDINYIPIFLKEVINAWMQGKEIPKVEEEMAKLQDKYSFEEWETNIDEIMKEYVVNRISEINEIKTTITDKKQ